MRRLQYGGVAAHSKDISTCSAMLSRGAENGKQAGKQGGGTGTGMLRSHRPEHARISDGAAASHLLTTLRTLAETANTIQHSQPEQSGGSESWREAVWRWHPQGGGLPAAAD